MQLLPLLHFQFNKLLKDATLEVLHQDVAPLQHVRHMPIIRASSPSSDDEASDDLSFSLKDSDVLDTAFLRALRNNFPFLDTEVEPQKYVSCILKRV